MYNNIADKIEAILNGITEIKEVFDTEVVQPTKYPYATVIPVSRSSTYKTVTGFNQRDYIFSIKVYGNMKDTTVNTQKVIRTIASKIDDAIESKANLRLGGTINYTLLSDSSFRFASAEVGLYIYEVSYKASVIWPRQ